MFQKRILPLGVDSIAVGSIFAVLGGIIALFSVFGVSFMPYQIGRLGYTFYLAQLFSGILMLYSGIFIIMFGDAHKINLNHHDPKFAGVFFILLFVFYLLTIVFGIYYLYSYTLDFPTIVDYMSLLTSMVIIAISFAVAVLNLRYLLRFHRLKLQLETVT